jgi:hypothetical protein
MRRALRVAAALALVALGAWGGLSYLRLRRAANVGAGYVAKQMCSCMFVGGRSFASCRPDMPSAMDRIVAEPTPEADGIVAGAALLAERTARYRPGFGCTIERGAE